MASKIFEVPFYTGSMVDTVSGIVPTVTGTVPIVKTEKGMAAINRGNDSNRLYYTKTLSNSTYTVVSFIRHDARTLNTYVADFRYNSGVGFIIAQPSNNYQPSSVGATYVNGVLTTSLTPAKVHCLISTISITCSRIVLFSDYNDIRSLKGSCAYFAIYSGTLSEAERNKIQAQFENLQPITSVTTPDYQALKPMSLNESGLVAAYNFIPNGNVLTDISGNGKTTTISKCISTKDGLITKANISTTSLPNIIYSVWSVLFRFSDFILTTTVHGYFSWLFCSAQTSSILIRNNKFTFRNVNNEEITWSTPPIISSIKGDTTVVFISNGTSIELYLNGVSYGSLTPIHDTILSINSLNGTGSTSLPNTSASIIFKDLRIYNRALSAQEAKNYHNQFAKRITLREDFSDQGADGVAKVPTGWIKSSGSFTIKEMAAQDPVLTHLKKGTRFLECLTAGAISIPSKQAYGTWEFDWYKGADINNTIVSFICNSKNTYPSNAIYITTTERLQLTQSSLSYIFSTAISFISNNTWYRLKITRTLSGLFTVYIKGGSFGTNQWILAVPELGTNPVASTSITTSEYMVISYGAGDRIANIQLTEGIVQ